MSLFSRDLSSPGGPRARKPGLHPPLGGLQLQFFLCCELRGGLPAQQPGSHVVHRLGVVERASPGVQRYVSPRTRRAFCLASRPASAFYPTWGLFKALGKVLPVIVFSEISSLSQCPWPRQSLLGVRQVSVPCLTGVFLRLWWFLRERVKLWRQALDL